MNTNRWIARSFDIGDFGVLHFWIERPELGRRYYSCESALVPNDERTGPCPAELHRALMLAAMACYEAMDAEIKATAKAQRIRVIDGWWKRDDGGGPACPMLL